MDDLGDQVLYWLTDDANQSILLFVLAFALGLSSLLLFFASGKRSATRLEFGLLVAAMGVLFYMTLRNSSF